MQRLQELRSGKGTYQDKVTLNNDQNTFLGLLCKMDIVKVSESKYQARD